MKKRPMFMSLGFCILSATCLVALTASAGDPFVDICNRAISPWYHECSWPDETPTSECTETVQKLTCESPLRTNGPLIDVCRNHGGRLRDVFPTPDTIRRECVWSSP